MACSSSHLWYSRGAGHSTVTKPRGDGRIQPGRPAPPRGQSWGVKGEGDEQEDRAFPEGLPGCIGQGQGGGNGGGGRGGVSVKGVEVMGLCPWWDSGTPQGGVSKNPLPSLGLLVLIMNPQAPTYPTPQHTDPPHTHGHRDTYT